MGKKLLVLVLLLERQRIAFAVAVAHFILVALDVESLDFVAIPGEGHHTIAVGREVVLPAGKPGIAGRDSH